jgi:hypothetical protein
MQRSCGTIENREPLPLHLLAWAGVRHCRERGWEPGEALSVDASTGVYRGTLLGPLRVTDLRDHREALQSDPPYVVGGRV